MQGLFEDGQKALCLLPLLPQARLLLLYRSSRQITIPFLKKMAYLSNFGQIRTCIFTIPVYHVRRWRTRDKL